MLFALLAVMGLVQAGIVQGARTAPCWQRLVRDWSDGRIDGAYSVGCYRAALRKLPEDLRVYSSAPDDIQAALQRKLSRSGARASRGLAVSGSRQAARKPVSASGGTSLDRPTVLAAALGAFGLALVLVSALASRRRRN